MLMPVKEESLLLNAGVHILFLSGCYLISILGINTEGRIRGVFAITREKWLRGEREK